MCGCGGCAPTLASKLPRARWRRAVAAHRNSTHLDSPEVVLVTVGMYHIGNFCSNSCRGGLACLSTQAPQYKRLGTEHQFNTPVLTQANGNRKHFAGHLNAKPPTLLEVSLKSLPYYLWSTFRPKPAQLKRTVNLSGVFSQDSLNWIITVVAGPP